MALTWGVRAVKSPNLRDLDDAIAYAHRVVVKNPVLNLHKGDNFVISAGVPLGKSGTTNLALIQRV